MALNIFLVLSGLAVVFLLYALSGFWKEGHRSVKNARKYAAELRERNSDETAILTHPIPHNAQGGLPVIPFQARDRYSDTRAHRRASSVTQEQPVRRFSSR
jgi:hypothetical protein